LRLKDLKHKVEVRIWGKGAGTLEVIDGKVPCREFPLVVMTSNGECKFPPAFLRRCLQLRMQPPDRDKPEQIAVPISSACRDGPPARAQRGSMDSQREIDRLIDTFLKRRDEDKQELATDQLLNAIQLVLSVADLDPLLETVFAPLSGEQG